MYKLEYIKNNNNKIKKDDQVEMKVNLTFLNVSLLYIHTQTKTNQH